jgi:hypothetical protein
MSQKTIEAVIEISPFEIESPWAVAAVAPYSLLRLFSGTNDEEIGAIMLTACLFSRIKIHASAVETLKALVGKDFIMSGGLLFSEEGQEKVRPGCCCGLENWREWLDVPSGKLIWAGHDPTPEVEFVDGGVRVWQDQKADGVDFIDFGVDEMRVLLEKVESDLQGFLYRLGKWTDFVAPGLKRKVVSHFAKNMDI